MTAWKRPFYDWASNARPQAETIATLAALRIIGEASFEKQVSGAKYRSENSCRESNTVWGMGCPWLVRGSSRLSYTGGHPQPTTPFPSGGFAAAGERGSEGEERCVCSTERKHPTDKPWAFVSPNDARTAQGRGQDLPCKFAHLFLERCWAAEPRGLGWWRNEGKEA